MFSVLSYLSSLWFTRTRATQCRYKYKHGKRAIHYILLFLHRWLAPANQSKVKINGTIYARALILVSPNLVPLGKTLGTRLCDPQFTRGFIALSLSRKRQPGRTYTCNGAKRAKTDVDKPRLLLGIRRHRHHHHHHHINISEAEARVFS